MIACAVILMGAMSAGERPILLPGDVSAGLRHHPGFVEAEEGKREAEAGWLKQRGAFDLKLSSKAGADPLGKYQQRTLGVAAEQAIPVWGQPRVFGGYRFGNDLPVYEGKKETDVLGRLEGGVRVDVGRGFFNDAERTGLKVAELGVQAADAELRVAELGLTEAAMGAYWSWVVAGHKLVVEERLVRLAQKRQTQIDRQITAGKSATILRVDNQRLVLSREASLETARLTLLQAQRRLEYFLRNESGIVQSIGSRKVPYWGWAEVPQRAPSAPLGPDDRPEFEAFRAVEKQLRAVGLLAEEGHLPTVLLELQIQQDMGGLPGDAWAIGETKALAGISVAWQVQRSKARGEAASVRAKLGALHAKRRQKRESFQVKIDNLSSTLETQLRRLALEREASRAALKLEIAERRRFALGQSDLIAVNLREVASAKGLSSFWTTAGKAELAYAKLRLATGEQPGAPLINLQAVKPTVPSISGDSPAPL